MSIPSQLSNFSRVSPNVLLSSLPGTAPNGTKDAPDLIIINAWMGAALKHIAKYTTEYSKLYPSSRLAVITNEVVDIMWKAEATMQKRLLPVVDAIRSVVESSSGKPKILLHTFSNGGNNQAVQLASAYSARYGEPLPLTAVVMDSAPGRPKYSGAVLAFKAGLPRNPLLYWVGMVFVHLVVISFFVSANVFGSVNLLNILRERLNDPKLFSQRAPRMYIYSKADELVEWQDVEDHATESEKLGWTVHALKFEKSRHVGHAVLESEKYWNTVQDTWKEGLKRL